MKKRSPFHPAFEKLKSLKLESPPPPKKSETPVKKPAEKDLFLEAMEGVKKLPPSKRKPLKKSPAPPPTATHWSQEADEFLLQSLVEGTTPLDIKDSDEYIEFKIPSFPQREFHKLKKGEFSIESYLDLHGFTKEEAKLKMIDFLDTSMKLGKRCVLIITGRGKGSPDGKGVIRESIQKWLQSNQLKKQILAFCSARPKDGGLGALYILLKRKKEK